MSTPDLTGYSDLVLYDVSPTDLVNRAVLDASIKLPDWQPRDSDTSMVLFEAMSLIGAELVYGINRLPSATTTTLIQMLGITRSQGSPATATVTFAVSDTLGHTIPAGTIVRYTTGDGVVVDFTTDTPAACAAGATVTAAVGITATSNTAAANALPTGTVLELVSSVPYVDTVTLNSAVAAGADAESDDDWRSRALQRFARLNETLVRPQHFTAEALTYPQVLRATAVDNYDGTGTNPGHVTVAVLGSNGATLSSGDKTAIQADLASLAQGNLAVHVIDPTITNVDVTATVMALPGYVGSAVQANVVAALAGYLSTDTWAWSGTVRINELISVISAAAGVDYVQTITVPSGDQALTGAAPLAKLRTPTITVNTP